MKIRSEDGKVDISLVSRLVGIEDQEILRVASSKRGINVHLRTKKDCLRCSSCGSINVLRKSWSERELRTTPVGMRSINLVVHVQRLQCRDCGAIRQERLGFADARMSYTYRLEEYVDELLKGMTKLDVARNLGMSWNTVREIERSRFDRKGR